MQIYLLMMSGDESGDVLSNGRVTSATDTVTDSLNDEDKLRQEAARRLERRRRKMLNPEERLAKITGRPVPASPPSSPSVETDSSVVQGEQMISTSTSPADDPPLETLTRDAFSNFLTTPGSSSETGDMLSSLMSGHQTGAAAGQHSRLNDVVWVMLAVLVRLVLDTEFAPYIAHNCVLPFILTLASLYLLGLVTAPQSTASSLLSAGDTF